MNGYRIILIAILVLIAGYWAKLWPEDHTRPTEAVGKKLGLPEDFRRAFVSDDGTRFVGRVLLVMGAILLAIGVVAVLAGY